jgi:DNA-binding SARP family transcriptional activator/tetratricopeptide (TPR) repeat protein
MMQFRLLGPVEIETDGRPVALARRRERFLLAVLLLEPGRVVPAHRLAELLWEDNPPRQARRALYSHVARVRSVLAKAGADAQGVALLSCGDGYQINVQPEAVDVHRFRGLVEEATKSVDLTQRDKLLRDALALWRGPALHNSAGERIRARICADLNELRLNAIEESMATGLALGRHRELIPELARLTTDHPLRGRLARLHMLALHHAGRTTDALDVYITARTTLAEELGMDPEPALRQLHEAILRGEPVPASDLTATSSTSDGAATPPAQLPADIAAFTGRDLPLKTLDALLDAGKQGAPTAVVICAIAGTAGVGKTALAVHWAHRVAARFPDGQLYVNLRAFHPNGSALDPAVALGGFLDALGVPRERIPADLPAQIGLYRSQLAGKRILVLLDNARDAEQVRPLLPGAPGCLALVTSRHQLTGLVVTEGAHPLTLDLLTIDESRDLLARRLGPERTTAEPEATDEVIALCAHLPLALAIMAARAATKPALPLAALARQLRETASQLDAFDSDDPLTNLRTVLACSYQALTAVAARMFRLLGMLPGPDFTASAAGGLADRPLATTQVLLGDLARAHLIMEHVPGRYTLHDLLRAYATEQAHLHDTARERHTAIHRLLDHYLHSANAAARLLSPNCDALFTLPVPNPAVAIETFADPEHAWAWFTAEHHVLIAAVNHATAARLDHHIYHLAWTLVVFLDRQGLWLDSLATQHLALAAAERVGDRSGQALTIQEIGRGKWRLGQYDSAYRHFQHALDLFSELGDHVGKARTHLRFGLVLERRNQISEALNGAEEAHRLYEAAGHKWGQAKALNAIGWYCTLLGDHPRAVTHCRQALTRFQEIDDQEGQADTWDSLGHAHHRLGDHEQALVCYQRSIDLYREIGARRGEADTMVRVGDTHDDIGDREAATNAWQHALTILEQLGHPDAEHVRDRLSPLDS